MRGSASRRIDTSRPELIFDGDCGFCRAWVDRYRETARGVVDIAASQDAAPRHPDIPVEIFARTVVYIENGEAYTEAEAIFRFLSRLPGSPSWPFALYRKAPVLGRLADAAYRAVAANRPLASRLTRWLWGPSLKPATFHASRRLFLRLLALCYLAAFVSLWVQADGLYGDRGILPVSEFLKHFAGRDALWRWHNLPTLMWLRPEAGTLSWLCAGGAGLSVLLFAGVFPLPVLALLWAFYLSLSTVGGIFLGYQWDALLLETGFLALFYAPNENGPVPRSGRWLLYLLLFKLMFLSGAVKLLSGDPAWRDLTAMTYHYETQCLPTLFAWYAHHLPVWFHRLETLGTFAVELGLSFLIFLPRRPRFLAGGAFIGLMGVIALTGNYTFFNLLTIALAVTLFDDEALKPLARLLPRFEETAAASAPVRRLRTAAAAFLVFVNLGILAASLTGAALPGFAAVQEALAPYRTVNGYGLFAVMTKSRPEIVIEGTRDGKVWREYEFKWKAGDVKRAPGFVAPHQPRLDWQMWFGALSGFNSPRTRQWFVPLLARLLEGSPPVLGLLAKNPFPEGPPAAVRALYYDYKFADSETRRETGAWWTRELLGAYSPTLSRRP